MIETELKFFVRDYQSLREELNRHASARNLRYNDQYFNHRQLDFEVHDSEFRIRRITDESDASTRTVLTYKADIIDPLTESKHEYEIMISSSQQETRQLVEAMGFDCYIEFEKICEHYEFEVEGRRVAATIVSLNEVADRFVEIETLIAETDDSAAALEWLSIFAASLGLSTEDQTVVTYEGTVARARQSA